MDLFQFILSGGASLVSVAFATFVGAWAAFKLERYYRRLEVRKEHFEKARKVQLALFENWGILNEIISKINDFKDDDLRSIKLGFIEVVHHGIDIDIDSVLFLLGEDQLNLLHNLVRARSKFNIVLALIKEHRELFEELYPSSGVELYKIRGNPEEYFKNGEHKKFSSKFDQLALIGNNLFENVPLAEEQTKKALLDFEEFLKGTFGDQITFMDLLKSINKNTT
jgi:hypothetical protein